MRRSVLALPVILIGMLVATASPTATSTAPAGAVGGARLGVKSVAPARLTDAGPTVAPVRAATPANTVSPNSVAPNTVAPKATPTSAARASDVPASELRVALVGDESATGLDVAVDPGNSVVRSFVVTNESAGLRLTVRFSAVDAQAASGGKVKFSTSASTGGPASWLSLSDLVATLEPGAQAQVSVTVQPPANAFPGNVLAGLLVHVDSAVRVADDSAVPDSTTTALPVAIIVKGAATALVSITHVDATTSKGQEQLEIAFQNSGATANTMVGSVQVLGPNPSSVPVHASVAPLAQTIVRVPFAMPPNVKSVHVSVETQDGSGDQAAWSGSVGDTATPAVASAASPRAAHAQSTLHKLASTIASRGASLPKLPLLLVSLALLAAITWFGAELRRSRKRRRAIALAPPAITPAPVIVAQAVGDADAMGAVAVQLGALVDVIERLVRRLGETPPAVAAAPAPVVAAAPAVAPAPTAKASAPAPVVAPAPTVKAPVPVAPVVEVAPAMEVAPARPERLGEPSPALLYAPAAFREPRDEVGPDGWPSPAQLERNASRRRTTQTKRSTES